MITLTAFVEALGAGIAAGAVSYGATNSIEGAIIAALGVFAAKLTPSQVTGNK